MSTVEPHPILPPVIQPESSPAPVYTLGQLAGYFLRLGTLGFGGPVALVGYMHRDLVEDRHWVTAADYKEGLTLSQLMPGPLAAQLGIYMGYVHYGVLGATVAGMAFVLPSFLMVLAVGWAYVAFGGLPWMQAVFYGVGAAVIGIIAVSAYKLTRKTIASDNLLWLLWLISAVVTVVTETESIWLFLGAGTVTWVARTPPGFFRRKPDPAAPTAGLMLGGLPASLYGVPAADPDTLWKIAVYFTKAGAFVFGSGLAIIPFLYGGVVKEYGWLDDNQFLDAVAVAMVTPGPVVITVAFIGYLVDGFAGAAVAAVAIFLPCYLLTVLPAPYFKKYGQRPGLIAFVDGVTAAAIGAIAGAVVVLGRRTIFENDAWPDPIKVVLLLVTIGILVRFKKLPEPAIIFAAALIGLAVYPIVRP